ncbi:MAG: bifunctional nicotinamidase/pyrazinamidase [Candidatus Omnitrophota bacterium]
MKKSALLIVDVQNDFCSGGALPVPQGDQVVPVLNQYGRAFREAALAIFASRDWHPSVTKHFKAYGGLWPPHCVQGTKGAEFHPKLSLAQAAILSKGMDPEKDSYSAFHASTKEEVDFGALLKQQGIQRLFVGGLATDYCVKHSVLDACRRGLETYVLEDAIRGVVLNAGDSERALREMKQAGAKVIRFQKLDLS